MRRWLKSITPQRQLLENRWFLRPFASVMMDPRCWTFHRNNVARAFALGLFIAFIPPTPLPVHLFCCAVFGVMLRLNLPVLFATIFVSNPFTWVPQVLGSIWVGAKLMGLDLDPFLHLLKSHDFYRELHALWGPLLLGAAVLGMASAVIGYALAQFAWRLRIGYLLRRRRARSCSRSRSLDQNTIR